MSGLSVKSEAPELRRDPISGRWVIIAPARGRRPSQPVRPAPAPGGDPCPFCPGNEAATPPEIVASRPAGGSRNGPGWTLRVFPNKFAALVPDGTPDVVWEGIYERMDGVGAHEVIVESPEHERELSELPLDRIEQVLTAYRDRSLALGRDRRIRYVLVFKNHGEWAGATQDHSHTQILATPVIPSVAAEELAGSRRRFEKSGRCVFCEVMERELAEGSRIVSREESFLSFTPYASRFAYETWVLPRRHAASFANASEETLRGLAPILKETLGRIRSALARPDYNFLIHTAPCAEPDLEFYHWHIEIIPKLSRASGFEWGTGAYINPTPPEEAAERLRSLSPAEFRAS